MRTYDVLIVGAGHGGAQTASVLRQAKFGGSIAMIGEEAHLPYERPALSKEYLAGAKPFDRLLIRPAAFWEERGIDMLLGRRAAAVEPDRRLVRTDGGEEVGYRSLVWAAGGAPRRLACGGHDLRRVHVVRNRADVDRMTGELAHAERVVVIGAGYIGLESAAVLSKLGKRVTVLEAQGRVLARVAGEALSRFYEAEHRHHGVEVRTGVTVTGIEGRDGAACGVQLADGTILPADMVIAGIGIEPAVGPLLQAGAAAGAGGVEVDEHCRTSLSDVFAVGDCAAHRSRHTDGVLMRIESVQNANDQAATVAKYLAGQRAPYDAVPWFWSSQYDLRLQTVGLSVGYDEEIIRGDPAVRSFSVIYRRNGRVVALDCVNAPRDYVQGKALLQASGVLDKTRLSDTGVALKELA